MKSPNELAFRYEHALPAGTRRGRLAGAGLGSQGGCALQYIHRTLFAQPIDTAWVEQLTTRDDLAEKIDAFVSRFGRLQDRLGEKLIPRFAALLGESPKSPLDVLAYAEKMQWVDSAEVFIGARKLRNLLVHEYMNDTRLFLQALLSAREAAEMLFCTVAAIEAEAVALGLHSQRAKK